jgi:uncharacterized protein YbjT (DUF2867 family)
MILVTGATGRVGSTLVATLLRAGEPVRVLTRNSHKAATLHRIGASVIVGDFAQLSTLKTALSGCDLLMSIPPNTLNQAEQEIQLFEVAKCAGVQHIVKLSTAKASSDSACHFFKQHAIAEEYLKQLGVAFTILKSNSFMQNFLWFTHEMKTKGTLSLPMKDASTAPVDIRDVADTACRILTKADYTEKTLSITGLEILSFKTIAKKLSAVTNQKIRYVNISADHFKRTLLQSGLQDWHAESVVTSWQVASQEPPIVTDMITEIIGKRPIEFEQFIQDYKRTLS